jgi:hypothetical protein
MKSIRKSNLFTTTVVMLFLFSIIGFWGCEKESLIEDQYVDYLDLDTYDLSKMTVKEMEIIGQALQRINIDKKNGLYEIKQASGKQVNISEELFEYIKKGFEHTNKILKPKTFNNLIPRLKSGNVENDPPEDDENDEGDSGDEDNSQPIDTTYCVAHALAGMGGTTFEIVKAYMDHHGFSNGVPPGALDSIVYHFYPNAIKSNSSRQSRPLNNALIWYRTSATTGHAVNAIQQYGDAILYYDHQNNTQGIIASDSLSTIYYPWY